MPQPATQATTEESGMQRLAAVATIAALAVTRILLRGTQLGLGTPMLALRALAQSRPSVLGLRAAGAAAPDSAFTRVARISRTVRGHSAATQAARPAQALRAGNIIGLETQAMPGAALGTAMASEIHHLTAPGRIADHAGAPGAGLTPPPPPPRGRRPARPAPAPARTPAHQPAPAPAPTQHSAMRL